MAQLSHPFMTTEKTTALTTQTFVDKVMSLLFIMMSRFLITFLPRRKHLLISWLQTFSTVILEPKKIQTWVWASSGRWLKHRDAWHAAVHGLTKCQTQLSNWTNSIVRKNFTISHLIINNYVYVSRVSRVSVLFNRQQFVLSVFILLLKVS